MVLVIDFRFHFYYSVVLWEQEMETSFKHVCEISASAPEIVRIIEWLSENYDEVPNTFTCYSLLEADFKSNTTKLKVVMTVNFKSIEGVTAFKLKWVE